MPAPEERLFHALANAAPVLIWMAGLDKGCTFFNRQWLDFTGRTLEQERGIGWAELVHPEDRDGCWETYATAFDARHPFAMHYRLRRQDGEWRWLADNGAPHFSPEGEFLGYIGSCVDITDHRQAQTAFQESEERFRALIENASDLITVIDRNAFIRFQSPAVIRMLGYTPEIMTGQNALAYVHPDDIEEVTAAINRVVAQIGVSVSVEYRFRHADGSWRILQSVGRTLPAQTEDGFVVVNSRDLTESRKLEEQFHQAQKMEAVGQLAGGVAHDFNNLLSVIAGYSELINLRLEPGDPLKEPISEILQASRRAAALTRQLLTFSRQQVLELKVLDLNAVVADTEKMLQRLIGEDVRLTTTLSPDIHSVRIDPGQLGQVILNLAVNARDAMPRGGQLTIETRNVALDEHYARLHPETTPGNYVQLSVSDTGAGMPVEVQARIFEPFFTTKGVGRGTGLGLSVVHGIVKQAGGQIGVYSELGIGTTLKIYLPAVPDRASKTSPAEPERLASGGEIILLVEDDDSVRRLTAKALEYLGYTVLKAASGQEALTLAEEQGGVIDLLLTDVVMPEISGNQLASMLVERYPRLKVLYQSGYTDDAVVRHGILQTDVAFLQKPFSLASLADKVREVLGR